MGKHFIDRKRSEILSVFPCTTQIALFWPMLLPALFLKKPWYPCPFEILEEALKCSFTSSLMTLQCLLLTLHVFWSFLIKLHTCMNCTREITISEVSNKMTSSYRNSTNVAWMNYIVQMTTVVLLMDIHVTGHNSIVKAFRSRTQWNWGVAAPFNPVIVKFPHEKIQCVRMVGLYPGPVMAVNVHKMIFDGINRKTENTKVQAQM
jgi:hypothetical protein